MSLMFRGMTAPKNNTPNVAGFYKAAGCWRYRGHQIPDDLVEYIPFAANTYNMLLWNERLAAWVLSINTGIKEVG